MEEEFVSNQERLKPQEERNQEERTRVDDIRGTPMTVGTLEEIIDDHHAIISSATGPENYVTILSFVDKDQLEPGCSVLLHNKARFYLKIFNFRNQPTNNLVWFIPGPLCCGSAGRRRRPNGVCDEAGKGAD